MRLRQHPPEQPQAAAVLYPQTADPGAIPAVPPIPDDTAVLVDAVTKYFYKGDTRFTALAATSLTIRRNEFVALLGPSGCGKSTLLNLIAGIVPADEGRIVHGCTPLKGMAVGTGYMTQHDTLLPWRTVYDNVALPLRIAKTYGAEKARVRWALELVGLQGFAQHYPAELSGGMRKRVALAQNLVYARELLLMDEPFGALDAQTRTVLQSQLLDIWTNEPRTIVFVTHDIEEAILLADRVVVMGTHPGHVSTVLDINIPRPRDVALVRFTERFSELYRAIWKHVFELNTVAGAAPFADEATPRRGWRRLLRLGDDSASGDVPPPTSPAQPPTGDPRPPAGGPPQPRLEGTHDRTARVQVP